MSHQLIARSPDLAKLREEGYGIEVRAGKYLLVHPVPYVTDKRAVVHGSLVCELTFAGNDLIAPKDHVMYFIGEYPCDSDGKRLEKIFNPSSPTELTPGLVVDHTFSAKPVGRGGYVDFYEKVTVYIGKLLPHAQLLDSAVTAQTFRVVETTEEESPFRYPDTASSNAKIDMISAKLEKGSVGIVGIGGTGAYVLDLVAKTPVKQIHLFDGDSLSQHNAFRSPGAATAEELNKRPKKVAYWASKYSAMRHRLFAHDYFIDDATVNELLAMDFVFICIDRGPARKLIAETLEQHGKSFIDVGMGLVAMDGSLHGITRVTTVTPTKHDHTSTRLPFAEATNNEYIRNIQIADLNALNAAFAVIRWKKLWDFYADGGNEFQSTFSVASNVIANDEVL
jgi:ThiF family